MASLHQQKGNRPGFKIRWREADGRQRTLWLGQQSKRAADTVFRHVSELIRAQQGGVRPDASSEQWANSVRGRIRKRLAELGLAAPEREALHSDQGRFLEAFVESYIQNHGGKPSTITNFRNAKSWLLKHFDGQTLLTEISSADCKRFHKFLLENLAVSTAEKITKRCKTMFTFAVDDRLLDQSPFDAVKLTGKVNRDRDYNVTREVVDTVIDHTGDHDWKAIFALARYAGLRRCELTVLKWTDVLWEQNKLRIDSPKTGVRFCPLFPEVYEHLLAASEAAPDGSVFVVRRYRRDSNLGTQANRIVESAGFDSWPKTFVNLRASRRTELEEQFPNHVVNSWLGHSSKVAERHYLQVTDDHWERASTDGGNARGNSTAPHPVSSAIEREKTTGKTPTEGQEFPEKRALAPPTGLEPVTRWLTATCSTN